jgi:hypothetical protein
MKKVGFLKNVYGRLVCALLIALSVSAMLYTSSDKVQSMVNADLNIGKTTEKSVAQTALASVGVPTNPKILVKNDWTEKVLHIDSVYSFDSPVQSAQKSPQKVNIKTVNKEEWTKKLPVKKQKAQQTNNQSAQKKVVKTKAVTQKEEEILVAKYVTKSALENESLSDQQNVNQFQKKSIDQSALVKLSNDSIAKEIALFEKYLTDIDEKVEIAKKQAVAEISTEDRALGPVTIEEEQKPSEINLIKIADDSSNDLLVMRRIDITEVTGGVPATEQSLPRNQEKVEVLSMNTANQQPDTKIITSTKKERKEADDTVTMFEEKSGIAEESLKQQSLAQKLSEQLLIAEKQQQENLSKKIEEAEKAKMEEAALQAEIKRKEADMKASAQKQRVEKQQENVVVTETLTREKEVAEIVASPIMIEEKVYSFKEDHSIALKTINGPNNSSYHATPSGSAIYARRFSEVKNFWYGRAAVRNEDKWFFIDTTGTQVSKEYWSAWNYKEGFAVVAERDSITGNILYSHIDTEGKEMYSEKFKDLSDFKKVDQNGNWTSELPKVNLVAFGRKLVSEKKKGKPVITQVIYQIDGYGNITPYTGVLDTRFK